MFDNNEETRDLIALKENKSKNLSKIGTSMR